MGTAVTLDDIADNAVWVAWLNEPRGDDPTKATKVPYSPRGGGKARSNNPKTWATREEAEGRAEQMVNGSGGGIGVILGVDCGDNTVLGGIDLDTCRSPEGVFEPWATAVIDRFASYVETSPSGTGAKVLFRYRAADLPRLREKMGGAKHGRMFKRRAETDHPPAIELHLSNRYFTVTGEAIKPNVTDLRLVEFPDLDWLLTEAGPAFARNGASEGADAASRRGARDGSRSGAAFRLGMRVQRAGGDFEAFAAAVKSDPETADWYREKGAANDERELRRIWEKADDGLPTIRLAVGERPRIVVEAIDALDAAGVPFYRRGLSIVNVAMIPAKASDGSSIKTPAIVTVPAQQLVHELGKAAHWLRYDGRSKDWVPADAPADIAAKIAALPNEWKFYPLAGIVGTQTMRPDGTLLTEPGYDPSTSFLLFEPPAMLAIPDRPTRQEAHEALGVLRRLLSEFPFADQASRSVALSMLMTPVLRPALMPAVPLHATSAPAPASGKSYMADLASAIATGERCPVITRSPSAEETEKRLVGAALTGQPIIAIDNVNGDLRGEFLCQAIERPLLQVRALGSSDLARIANSITCFANGNNIVVAEDLVRRTIQCRLDANLERPETRKFKSDPLAAILADRGRYVAAVLTIARAYVAAGMPDKPAPFASFDRWSDLVRGALTWVGCADPCDTVADLAVADPARNERAEVFQAIAKVMVDPDYTVAEIIAAARTDSEAENALRMIASADGEISPKRLGKWLAAAQNTIAGGYKLLRHGTVHERVRWRLEPVAR